MLPMPGLFGERNMATESELTTRKEALDKMIASGVLITQYQGDRIEFRSMSELLRARTQVERDLLTAPGKVPIRRVNVIATKDL